MARRAESTVAASERIPCSASGGAVKNGNGAAGTGHGSGGSGAGMIPGYGAAVNSDGGAGAGGLILVETYF